MKTPTAPATLTLNTGARIPQVGLGVWQSSRGDTTQAVRAALRLGYGHVDTARIYGNEAEVGQAVRESGLLRGDVFVTTKLWNADQGYDSALRALDASLERLGLDHVDLYLCTGPSPESASSRGAPSSASSRASAPAPSASATSWCPTWKSSSTTRGWCPR